MIQVITDELQLRPCFESRTPLALTFAAMLERDVSKYAHTLDGVHLLCFASRKNIVDVTLNWFCSPLEDFDWIVSR